MAGVDATDLHALAEEFLAACVDSLNTVPTFDASLDGAPTRNFISPGLPAADCCPQLTVHVAALSQTPSSVPVGRSATYGRTNDVALVATLFRCANMDKNPPLQSELENAATQINADAWAAWNHIYNLIRGGQLFDTCLSVVWEGLRMLPPEGGCVGWVLGIVVQLDGYEETLST